MNPYVDEIITFHKKEFKSIGGFLSNYGPLKRQIQRRSYDAVLDLQGLFKSAAIARLAKAPVKLGMCNMRELSDRISRPVIGPHAQGHIVERYLDVARALGCRVDQVVFPLTVPEREADLTRRIFSQAGGNMGNPYVVFAIGANWPNKRWPIEYFAELSDWLYAQRLIPVIVGGGAVDEQRAAELCAAAEIPPINLVGRTNFKQLTCVLQHAQLTIGGDTGPVHLSAGVGTKTIMVMGPTDANRNGPYGQLENAIEVERSCKYCWNRACPKGLDCLADITVQQVRAKVEELI
jgi:heptosyltransferase-1